MGMFDYVRVLYPLPEGAPGPDAGWQTKDTDEQYLMTYELRADGTLWLERWRKEALPDAPLMPDDPDEWIKWERQWTKRVDDPPEQVKMTGAVNFYTFTESHRASATWWEFCALFDDGALLALREVDTPNTRATEAKP